MATTTLNTDIVIQQDGSTAIDGGTVDNDIFYSGGGSSSFTFTTQNVIHTVANGSGMATYQTHLRLRALSTAIPYLKSKALGGITLWATDGTNTAYWHVAGADTYQGGWLYLLVDTRATPDAGAALTSNITDWGIGFEFHTRAKNVVNTWVDMLAYGDYIEASGGTSGDEITFLDIYDADFGQGYGVVDYDPITGSFTITGGLKIGTTSSENTYFKDSLVSLTFGDYEINSALYELTIQQGTGTTDAQLSGCTVKGQNRRFGINSSGGSLDIDGGSFINAGLSSFKTGDTLQNITFDSCQQINPGASTFVNNSISNSPDNGGALLWTSISNISGCSFFNNDRAIEHDAAGTCTYDSLTFSNNTYQIHNSSSGTVTINVQNGGNAASQEAYNSNGGTTVVNNQKYKTFTGLPENAEVRIRQGSYTLAHDQDVTGGSYTFYYDPDNAKPATAQFTLSGYVIEPIVIDLDGIDQILPVTVSPDPSYV